MVMELIMVFYTYFGVGFDIFSFPKKSMTCQHLCPPSGSDSSANSGLGSRNSHSSEGEKKNHEKKWLWVGTVQHKARQGVVKINQALLPWEINTV